MLEWFVIWLREITWGKITVIDSHSWLIGLFFIHMQRTKHKPKVVTIHTYISAYFTRWTHCPLKQHELMTNDEAHFYSNHTNTMRGNLVKTALIIRLMDCSISHWTHTHRVLTRGACRLVRALTVCYELSGPTQRADRTTFELVLWCTWLFIQLAQHRTERFILFISLWAQIIVCLFYSIFCHLFSALCLRSPLFWVYSM